MDCKNILDFLEKTTKNEILITSTKNELDRNHFNKYYSDETYSFYTDISEDNDTKYNLLMNTEYKIVCIYDAKYIIYINGTRITTHSTKFVFDEILAVLNHENIKFLDFQKARLLKIINEISVKTFEFFIDNTDSHLFQTLFNHFFQGYRLFDKGQFKREVILEIEKYILKNQEDIKDMHYQALMTKILNKAIFTNPNNKVEVYIDNNKNINNEILFYDKSTITQTLYYREKKYNFNAFNIVHYVNKLLKRDFITEYEAIEHLFFRELKKRIDNPILNSGILKNFVFKSFVYSLLNEYIYNITEDYTGTLELFNPKFARPVINFGAKVKMFEVLFNSNQITVKKIPKLRGW